MTPEQVDAAMMAVNAHWRYRWCDAGVCGCMGAANCSGQVTRHGVTKEDWQAWVAAHPLPADEARRRAKDGW